MNADGDGDGGAQAHKHAKVEPKKVEGKEAKSPPPPAEKVLGKTGQEMHMRKVLEKSGVSLREPARLLYTADEALAISLH